MNDKRNWAERKDKFVEAIRKLVIELSIPAVRFIGKIKSPYSHKKAIREYYKIVNSLKPLDVILSNTYGHLSNLFNPGKWKHAIIYLGVENDIPMVAEAIGEGVVKRPLVECIAEKDRIAVMRLKDKIKKVEERKALEWANKQVGKGYDYRFDMETYHKFDNFYCSEYAYYTLKQAKPKMNFTLKEYLGAKTVKPVDFIYARDKFDLIYKTKKYI